MALELSQRFRRQVAPYSVVQSLAVLGGSNYCPALQTIKADGTPNIDRASVPTVIAAAIYATSTDGSGSVDTVTDSAVTNIKWYVQRGDETTGTDIQLHPDWTGHFTIGTGTDKGKLTVSLNIPAGGRWKIWMECDINDSRRGYTVAIPVVTDSVLLYSIADASDKYTMSIDRPNSETYEPALDKRLIHEYLTGLGVSHTFTDDGSTYLREVHPQLYRGGAPVAAADYAIKVYSIDPMSVRTEVTAATDPCISSIGTGTVTFDVRFAESKSYQIACFVGTDEVSHKSYGWVWSGEMPTTDEGIVGASTYVDGDKQTYKPKFNFGRWRLPYPTVAYDLQWYWRKPGNTSRTYAGRGEQKTFDLGTSGMFTDGETELILSIEKRGAFSRLSDGSGNQYVDENGDYLAEN